MSADHAHLNVRPREHLSAELARNDERRRRACLQRELVIASLLRCPEFHHNDAR
jgi:hypothetical protein